MASKDNLYFDNQSKQVVFLLSSQYFLKEKKHTLSFYQVINAHKSLGEFEKAMGTLSCWLVLQQHFLVFPNFHLCFY